MGGKERAKGHNSLQDMSPNLQANLLNSQKILVSGFPTKFLKGWALPSIEVQKIRINTQIIRRQGDQKKVSLQETPEALGEGFGFSHAMDRVGLEEK